jgi:hypothetical protein
VLKDLWHFELKLSSCRSVPSPWITPSSPPGRDDVAVACLKRMASRRSGAGPLLGRGPRARDHLVIAQGSYRATTGAQSLNHGAYQTPSWRLVAKGRLVT